MNPTDSKVKVTPELAMLLPLFAKGPHHIGKVWRLERPSLAPTADALPIRVPSETEFCDVFTLCRLPVPQ